MKDGWYNWAEFKEAVLGLLPLDRERLIQGDDGQLLTRLMRQGVLDLQEYIPVYRHGHETIYRPDHFVEEGAASRAVLPPQAQVQDAWLFHATNNSRYPLLRWSWANRFDLVNGIVSVEGNHGRLSIDEGAETFYVYPAVAGDWILSLNWDGLKADFQDEERVPFDEKAAGAVADFVRGNLARHPDNDLTMYASYFDPRVGSYVQKRRALWRTAKARTAMKH